MPTRQTRIEKLEQTRMRQAVPDNALARMINELETLRVAGKPLSVAIEERTAVLRRYVSNRSLSREVQGQIQRQIDQLDVRAAQVRADELRARERKPN